MESTHPLDALLCDLRDLTDALRTGGGVSKQGGGGGSGRQPAARAKPSSTARRQYSAQPSGRLLGRNEQRAGLLLHNASDGALLISTGEEATTLENYFYAVGPGETWDTRAVPERKNLVKALSYTWVDAGTDLTGYPSGIFPMATAGSLMVTEMVLPRPQR